MAAVVHGLKRPIVVLAPNVIGADLEPMLRNVVLISFPEAQSLDVSGPYEVFSAATRVCRAQSRTDQGYAITLLSPRGEPMRCESGLTLLADGSLARFRPATHGIHTLLICGGTGARRAAHDPRITARVKRLSQSATRIASVCTGAFVLAGAGLLDGKRATTHWARCALLRQQFPKVRVEDAPIYVRDGNVFTSAGVTAGIDLALALVDEDLGRTVAAEVARRLVVFVRRAGGQAQFSAQLSAASAEREPLRELMAWIVDHPAEDLDVPALAARVHLSVRHFSRLFRTETGLSPAAYVERVRLETARRLLETSAESVERVAAAAGFGTPEALRRSFARRLTVSPREYRARFGVH
jgi:transcriptional regulator GlxA family with amidase domain